MSDETLRCRCGGEVRLVRLNADYLTLGHVRNPKSASHYVRLAPAARTAVPAATGQPEGSESGSGLTGSARHRPAVSASESGPSIPKATRMPRQGALVAEGGDRMAPSTRPDPDPLRASTPSPVGRAVRKSRGLAPLAPAPRRSTERAGAL